MPSLPEPRNTSPAPNTTRSASVSTPSKRSSTASKRPPRPCPAPPSRPPFELAPPAPAHNPLQPPPARNAARGRGHRLWEHHRHHHWEHHRHHHWDLHLHLHLHIHLIHEPPRSQHAGRGPAVPAAAPRRGGRARRQTPTPRGAAKKSPRAGAPLPGRAPARARRALGGAGAGGSSSAAHPAAYGGGWDGAGDAGASEGRGDGTLRIDVNMHPSPPLSPGSASSPLYAHHHAQQEVCLSPAPQSQGYPPHAFRRASLGGAAGAERRPRTGSGGAPPPGDFTSARRPSEQQRRRASLGAAGYLTMGARDAPHPRLSPPAGVRLSPRAQHMMSPPPAPREPLSPRDDQGAGAGAVEGWMWRGGGVGRQGREEGREGGINCVARGVVVFALAFARARVLLAFLFCRCCPGFPDFLPSFPPSLLPPTGLSYRPSSSLSPACFLPYHHPTPDTYIASIYIHVTEVWPETVLEKTVGIRKEVGGICNSIQVNLRGRKSIWQVKKHRLPSSVAHRLPYQARPGALPIFFPPPLRNQNGNGFRTGNLMLRFTRIRDACVRLLPAITGGFRISRPSYPGLSSLGAHNILSSFAPPFSHGFGHTTAVVCNNKLQLLFSQPKH
ncbi:hypothetical protein B0H10DRAFT_2314454 [Mycena sp. CBHHK59/15]|nr:hypothetical protein B0H10DRAFT_2314454 [Mycena sp. CBHHK59/15]